MAWCCVLVARYLSSLNGLAVGSFTSFIVSTFLVESLQMTSRFVINICDVIIRQPKIGGVECFLFFVLSTRLNTTLYCQKMEMTTTRRLKRKSESSDSSLFAPYQYKVQKIPKGLKVRVSNKICTTGYNSNELLHLCLI